MALLAALVMATSACATPAPPVLVVSTVVSGLQNPWDVAFTPDGTMLFTERAGRVNAFVDGQVKVLAAPTDVFSGQEPGMLGLAVDPDFATNRRIYTCLDVTEDGVAVKDVRIARWTVAEDYSAATDRVDILTGIDQRTGEHSGCRLRFGGDGYLWVTTGDARIPTAPQDPSSLAGKILRIDTDGQPATDNPGGALRPEIYTLGHRNVQGLAFRPGDGMAFSVEHGTLCDDEVNRLVPGGNYGWEPIGIWGPEYYDEWSPMTDTVKFSDAIAPTWASGCPTIATSGATFLDGPQWKGWNGMLAVATLKDKSLRILSIGPDGTTSSGLTTVLTGFGRLRVPVQGPDGSLYIPTDKAVGEIIKVTPV